jgi:uncharacterized membrane protein
MKNLFLLILFYLLDKIIAFPNNIGKKIKKEGVEAAELIILIILLIFIQIGINFYSSFGVNELTESINLLAKLLIFFLVSMFVMVMLFVISSMYKKRAQENILKIAGAIFFYLGVISIFFIPLSLLWPSVLIIMLISLVIIIAKPMRL